MAKAKSNAKKARRPKQRYLPTLEPDSIPAIDKLADDYCDLRDERMRLWQQEMDKQALLQAKMKEWNLTTYEYDGRIVKIEGVEKVRVKKKKETAAATVEDNGDE